MRTHLNEPIIRMILVWITILSSFFLLFTGFEVYYNEVSDNYDRLIKNQENQRKLGRVIIRDLITIEKDFYIIASNIHIIELEDYMRDISDNLEEINGIISILQEGGTFVDILPVNFYDVYEIREEYTYVKIDEGYVIEAIELTPKLLDIERISLKLTAAINCSFYCRDEASRIESEKGINLLLKEADTYFTRSRESANKIFYDSNQRITQLEKEKEATLRYYNNVRWFILVLMVVSSFLLPINIILNVLSVINERNHTQKELEDSRNRLEEYSGELESKVEDRTVELENKVDELERFNKLMIDRELKMIELKKKIDELEDNNILI